MAEFPVKPLDKSRVRASFDKAAPDYDGVAVLQREVGRRLLERLDLVRLAPRRVADIGCGTGASLPELARRYPGAQLVALDLAEGMLRQSRRRFSWWARRRGRAPLAVCADAERLPLASASCDLLFSNLTLQWCPDPEVVFAELRRVLRPGGLLLFTTLGPDTLKELRAAWGEVDERVHVNRFVDMHDLGDAMVRAGLADPVMDMEYLTLTYRRALDLMSDLKTLGAHNVNPGRGSGLTGRRRLEAVIAAYERFRRDGLLPATHEVVYGHAWGAEPRAAVSRGGESRVGLAEVRAGLRGR